jgi:uncharacterized membrane protein
MHKNRLEAFSDGVLAIIITIMVLELKVPHNPDIFALIEIAPIFFSYLLSFLYIAIYWNNHHHLFQAAKHVTGKVLWANMHLLFWLSLLPFATGWAGENHFAPAPASLYGFVLLMSAVSYYLLTLALLASHGSDSALALALGRDWKGKISLLIYIIAIACAYWAPFIALALYTLVAIIWFIPDKRIEKTLNPQ